MYAVHYILKIIQYKRALCFRFRIFISVRKYLNRKIQNVYIIRTANESVLYIQMPKR